MAAQHFLLDDFRTRDGISALGTRWRVVSDQQQGGFSRPRIGFGDADGIPALLLHGLVVRLNAGGWIAADLPLSPTGGNLDCSAYNALQLRIRGDRRTYAVRLQTEETLTSRQYYEAQFIAPPQWEEITLPFSAFAPVGTQAPLNPARLTHVLLVGLEEGRVAAEVARVGLVTPPVSPRNL